MSHRTTYSCAQRLLFLSAALLAAALAQAQNINVTAANASNDAIYTVNFNNQTTHIENTDQGSLHSLRSIVFTSNGNNDQVDLLAADNAGGLIVRYCGNFNPDQIQNLQPPANTFGDVVWNNTQGGPTNPDGLSVDSAGNLFLVNQGSGTSTNPQVWVIQGLETDCRAVPARTPTVTQIDSKFNAKQTLEETLIAKSAIALTGANAPVSQINAGDLLVLTSTPASVLLYQGSGGLGPTGKTSPIVLLNSNNFPAGTQPGGMDFLPTDNSLLITTSTGTIFKFTVDQIVPATPPNQTPQIFVQGLGNGQFKVRTGQQAGDPNLNQPPVVVNVFVANNNGGDILEFDASGNNEVVVTQGVQHPQGLAVTNLAYQQAPTSSTNCSPPNPCNLNVLGGDNAGHPLLTNALFVQLSGNILEEMCVVLTDPRVAQYGSCTAAASAYPKGLPVAQVCGAGFDNPQNPLYIPNSMCGASGIKPGTQPPVQGSGFALIRTLTSAYQPNGPFPFNGTFIQSDSDFSGLPPGPSDPVCPGGGGLPAQVSGWAPLAGEGANPGLNSVLPGVNSVLDMINGCGTPKSGGGTLSLYVLGADLPADLPGGLAGYAATQYTTLLSTITAETQDGALASGNFGNFSTSQLQQCIKESKDATQKSFYPGAAQELLNEDFSVASVAGSSPPFKPDSAYPNPSGILRALIQTTWFTVDVRLGGGDGVNPPPPNPPNPPSFDSPVNIRPIIKPAPAPSTTGIKNQTYTFSPATTDFATNTATLTYSLTGLPWAKLIPASNNQVVVSGTPKQAGTFNATLTVMDGCSATSTLTWTVTITTH
jgi:hypothetical protein